jgi:MEDS: MEthanogen/methylotroph, DcmR Sensory domain
VHVPDVESPHPGNEAIRFAGPVVGPTRHICAFFHDEDEESRVLLPFIKEGLDRGDKAMHIVDPMRRCQHVERLEAQGLPIADAERRGQFVLHGWDEIYLAGNCFDPQRWLANMERTLTEARQQGFPQTRIICHMEWAVAEYPGVDRIVEHETLANVLWNRLRDPVICVYDLNRFSGGVVMGILRAHPMILIGPVLHENPFYLPPEEYLEELRTRRHARASRGDQAVSEVY